MRTETDQLTLSEAAQRVRDGELTSTELMRRAIEVADSHDAALGVFLARFTETALDAARHADTAVATGVPLGPLHGVPVGVKDILATREGPTTAQSNAWDPEWGRGDATAVARLRAAGAIVVGKTTTMEFAYGVPARTDPFPLPANPWNPGTWPGGSSSGTGAGTAAGMMLGGLGTDTAGSVRVPAAMCGITGLKPTFGLVPVDGCIPLAFSADHIGPMARTVEDCGLLLDVLADRPVRDGAPSGRLDGVRIGVDRLAPVTDGGGDPSVPGLLDAALAALAGLGADVVEVRLPLYRELTDAVFLSVAAERLAYHQPWLAQRWSTYGRSARLGMARGAYYSAADYVQAQRVRRVGQERLAGVFADVDAVVTPTASIAAPPLEGIEDCLASWKQLVHTTYWNATGNPAMSVPMGGTADGMPIGLQIAGTPGDEQAVLRIGEAYQRATDWHRQRPRMEG